MNPATPNQSNMAWATLHKIAKSSHTDKLLHISKLNPDTQTTIAARAPEQTMVGCPDHGAKLNGKMQLLGEVRQANGPCMAGVCH